LVAERDRGAGVLLISDDLDEIFNLSDRVIVIFEGAIIGQVDPAEANYEEIGLLMAGISKRNLGEGGSSS
jgi:simple sugar transport system ATP-binding protein